MTRAASGNLGALLAILLLAGCTSVPKRQLETAHIYHYVRSNLDGSEPEQVVQFRPNRTAISVYKWVEKCTAAAYVTATMDKAVREGRSFVAGKVAQDGSQATFGTLTKDSKSAVLEVDITPPGALRMTERWPLPGRPYLLFDFDFADLNAFLQEARPRTNFSYRLPVIWPSEASLFRDLGQLEAQFIGDEEHLGRHTTRFDLRVDGPQPSVGGLWIDASLGFIVEARLGLPNHQGYENFQLKLERVQEGGLDSWNALTRTHYSGCLRAKM